MLTIYLYKLSMANIIKYFLNDSIGLIAITGNATLRNVRTTPSIAIFAQCAAFVCGLCHPQLRH